LNEISLICTGDAKWHHQRLTVFCSQKDEGEKSFSKLTVPCDKKRVKKRPFEENWKLKKTKVSFLKSRNLTFQQDRSFSRI
jgi:hypothetical protein